MSAYCDHHTTVRLGGDPEECPACLAEKYISSVSNDQVYFEVVYDQWLGWIKDFQAVGDESHQQQLADDLVNGLRDRPEFLFLLFVERLTREMHRIVVIPKCPICQALFRDPQSQWTDDVQVPGTFRVEHIRCGRCQQLSYQAEAKRGAA